MNIRIQHNGYTKHMELFKKKVGARIPVEYTEDGLALEFCIDEDITAKESYIITGNQNDWKITGSDELGLYYGIGKFLHSATWSETDFVPKAMDKLSVPGCSFRIIYFSVHHYNWYQMAPVEELESYLEDLLLYGYNGIHCIIPVMNIHTYGDDVFKNSVETTRKLYKLAKKIGMKTSFGVNPNQGFLDAPEEFNADLSYDLVGNVRGWAGRNLCPNKPGAMEYLKDVWVKQLEQYTDIGIDYILSWPYDEGGCGCEECSPWGAKAYCDITIALRDVVKEYYPDAEFIACTWIFDKPHDQGEYEGIYKRMKGDMAWIDYLMVDAHADFPEYPLTHDVIKPVVNFPEISMWKLYPWGGYGANPLPKRFQGIWDSAKRILNGGMPYSEGMYDDILKIQYAGYYWEPDKNYKDILAEYINYEYSADVVDEVIEMMELIEINHVRVGTGSDPILEPAVRAAQLAKTVDNCLGERAKNAWRWRILYIRAIIDEKRYRYYIEHNMSGLQDQADLRHFAGEFLKGDEEAQEMFKELRRYYHSVEFNGENFRTLPPVNGGTAMEGKYFYENRMELDFYRK